MQFSEDFLQHYFLEVDSERLVEVIDTIRSSKIGVLPDTGDWTMFAWLDRPSLWCMRAIRRTSGLDVFLIDGCGLSGLIDVAELIAFPLSMDEMGVFSKDWSDFSRRMEGDGTLFATFLWLEWDNLLGSKFWGEGPPPPRSRILAAAARCLAKALRRVGQIEKSLLQKIPDLLLTATAGDADWVLYGWVQSSAELDAILLALSLLNVRAIAKELGFQSCRSGWPAFRASQTELAVKLDVYLRVREECSGERLSSGLRRELDNSFQGELYAEVGLARGRAPLGNLKDGLTKVAGDAWRESAVFGGEDLVLTAARTLTFGDIVEVLAKIEVEASGNGKKSFVRRSSLKLGVKEAAGSLTAMTSRLLYDPGNLHDDDLYGDLPPESFLPNFDAQGLADAREMISQLSDLGWREDVRIVERMIERCVTLQKAPELRRETRGMVARALKRIIRRCRKIRRLAKVLDEIINSSGASARSEPDIKDKIEACCAEIRLLRDGLLSSGMMLDSALSHHSKGVVALLLHAANQARGSDHIGSEVGLSLGMGSMFQSAARRVLGALPETALGETGDILSELRQELMDVHYPTVFASHDTDFSINAGMGMLRLPRWALWYPSASCHLMHEFGHALASIGNLGYLVTAVMRQIGGHASRNSREIVKHLRFIDEGKALEGTLKSNLRAFVRQRCFEKADHPFPKSGVLDELEEVSCDVVARLFAYPSGTDWDQRWLVDAFQYILPFAGRQDTEAIQTRLLRLMSAYLAAKLIQIKTFDSEANGEPTDVCSLGQKAVADFCVILETWLYESRSSANRPLPAYVESSLTMVVGYLRKFVDTELSSWGASGPESWFVSSGIIAALVFMVPPITTSEDVSAYRATQVWGRLGLVSGTWDTGDPENVQGDSEIVDALCKREVPEKAMSRPEHLPGLLSRRYEAVGSRLPPSTRIAMAFYLYDKYDFSI